MDTSVRTYRVSSVILAFGAFGLVVAAYALAVYATRFVGAAFAFAIRWYGPPTLAIASIALVVWAFFPPRRAKLPGTLIALIVAFLVHQLTPQIIAASDATYWRLRQAPLTEFTRDILAYGKISEMSDGDRHYKELNGELIAFAVVDIDTLTASAFRKTWPLDHVLARDQITREKYEQYRQRLRELTLIQFQVRPGYVAFLYDGFLDNLDGYLWVRDDARSPALNSELFGTQLIALQELGGGWYRFHTT
jgi:hypothetical protein